MKLANTVFFLAASAAAFGVLGQYRFAQSHGPAEIHGAAEITVGTVHFKGLPRDWSHQHLSSPTRARKRKPPRPERTTAG